MIEPFEIHVPDEVLTDLRQRLARTRYPDQIEDAAWEYGTDVSTLRELCDYWRDGFDWRKQESLLNGFDHFLTSVDAGQRLHFIHARSPRSDALPLLMTHGWPGSVFEFYKVLGPLTDPEAHGGDARDAFHVVCPSLPGYGWSGPTSDRGWDAGRMAGALAELMDQLGYSRYGAQGGDWGGIITPHLAEAHPESVCGIHLNISIPVPPAGVADPMTLLSPEERQDVARFAEFQRQEMGYFHIQSTRPQTLGYALSDSPAGLAGWIVEKFRAWSDCGGDLAKSYTKDELLTNIAIYWVTGTINSSMRLYCESTRSATLGVPKGPVTVPTAFAVFPKEVYRTPRPWLEARFNLQRWTEMEAGGHFAALEQPALLVDDVRAFFRDLR